ncbi:MAG: hypothetical protein R3C05_15730 [Pirellulaceae bacterium]
MSIRSAKQLTFVMLAASLTMLSPAVSQENDLAAFQKIGPEGAGHSEAIAAAGRLSKLAPERLFDVLAAMEDATPLGKNWLRVIAADIADNGDVPTDSLVAYIEDRSGSRDARYVAYLLLKDSDADRAEKLLDGMMDDPSLQLRYEAVAKAIKRAKAAEGEAAISLYNQTLQVARHPNHLKKIADALREAKQEVDLAKHMGFITQWKLVGPFDNTDMKGFDVVYPPEAEYLASADHTISQPSYDGKAGQVAWQSESTKHELGMVNLNPVYNNEKSAIHYGYVELESAKEQPAQARLGCIVANKIWVNGELIMSNEVYHARTGVDQYIADFTLQKGKNTLLIKTCQNDQTQSWAQDWEFQLRITDPDGAAIDFAR